MVYVIRRKINIRSKSSQNTILKTFTSSARLTSFEGYLIICHSSKGVAERGILTDASKASKPLGTMELPSIGQLFQLVRNYQQCVLISPKLGCQAMNIWHYTSLVSHWRNYPSWSSFSLHQLTVTVQERMTVNCYILQFRRSIKPWRLTQTDRRLCSTNQQLFGTQPYLEENLAKRSFGHPGQLF